MIPQLGAPEIMAIGAILFGIATVFILAVQMIAIFSDKSRKQQNQKAPQQITQFENISKRHESVSAVEEMPAA